MSESSYPLVGSTRWPNIGREELLALWRSHAPSFITIEDVERDLPRIRDTFLAWLHYKGVDLGQEQSFRLGKRARLEKVSLTRKGDGAVSTVTMSLGSRHAEASREGLATNEEMIRITAEATLQAVSELLPVVTFTVEQVYNIGKNPVSQIAMVLVHDPDSYADRFVGAAPVKASVTDAAAKATMSAINRRAEIAASMLGV